jgi:hypothetical protein
MTSTEVIAEITAVVPLLLALLAILYKQVQATAWGRSHQAVIRIWGLADDIATRIVDALETPTNPALVASAAGRQAQQASAVSAGVEELRHNGAEELLQVRGPTDDATLARLINARVNRQRRALAAAVVPPSATTLETPKPTFTAIR